MLGYVSYDNRESITMWKSKAAVCLWLKNYIVKKKNENNIKHILLINEVKSKQ